jgi:hypothetical protein
MMEWVQNLFAPPVSDLPQGDLRESGLEELVTAFSLTPSCTPA